MQQEDKELDQLIKIINKRTMPRNSQQQNRKTLPPLQQRSRMDDSSSMGLKQATIPKYLIFKPWSGTVVENGQQIMNGEAIKQEIQNQNDDGEMQYEGEKQDYMMEDSKIYSQMGGNNQVGYFYRFATGKVKLIKCLLDQNGFRDCHFDNKSWTMYWSSSPFKMQVYRQLMPYQKVNHFPNSFHLTRKDLMNKTVSKMQLKHGITHYNFLPKTYILPQQLDQLLHQHTKHPQTTYIVKPHNRSQGKGITVTTSMQTIYAKLQKYSSLIVSHYIGNPLLINKLKFDLRIYVAITGVNPLRLYVYEEGLARFATQEYDCSAYDSQNKKYQHLTNYSVNKKNSDFIPSNNQNQDYYGSKWSLTAMKDFLAYNIGRNQTNQLFDRIDDVLVKTILSAENLLYTSFQNNVPYINGCFQVLGFDIMIDSNLKPWLIQVNHSPSMNTDSSLDLKIKGNMIADLFTLAGFTPLGQRYLDGGHSKYESRHYFNIDERKSNQSAIDKFILKQIQAEYERRGGWRRVFPSVKNLRFKSYFQTDRYFNRLLRQKLLSIQKQSLPTSDTYSSQPSQYRSSTVGKPTSFMHKNTKPISIRLNKAKKPLIRGSSQKISQTSNLNLY